jgi:methionyl-tRNA synthetase
MPANKIVDHVETKRIYVWFDAVIGYLSASVLWAKENQQDWKNFWYGDNLKHFYFMGKDNLVFHTLFWPAQIMVYDKKLHLPDVASINMFLNHEGKQFSKSRGTSIPAKDIVGKYGNDAVRFYLTLIMPESKDSSFSWPDFAEKVNGVLVATLGNFIHRVLSQTKGMEFDTELRVDEYIVKAIEDAYHKSIIHLDKCDFRNYLNEILSLASFGNSVVDRQKIWELKKTDPDKFKTVVTELVVIILALRDLMNPVMPHATERLDNYLGLIGATKAWPEHGKEIKHLKALLSSTAVGDALKPLFNKIEMTEQ